MSRSLDPRCRFCLEGVRKADLARYCLCRFAHHDCVFRYIKSNPPKCPECKSKYALLYATLPVSQWRCGYCPLWQFYVIVLALIAMILLSAAGLSIILDKFTDNLADAREYQRNVKAAAVSLVAVASLLLVLFGVFVSAPVFCKSLLRRNRPVVIVRKLPNVPGDTENLLLQSTLLQSTHTIPSVPSSAGRQHSSISSDVSTNPSVIKTQAPVLMTLGPRLPPHGANRSPDDRSLNKSMGGNSEYTLAQSTVSNNRMAKTPSGHHMSSFLR